MTQGVDSLASISEEKTYWGTNSTLLIDLKMVVVN